MQDIKLTAKVFDTHADSNAVILKTRFKPGTSITRKTGIRKMHARLMIQDLEENRLPGADKMSQESKSELIIYWSKKENIMSSLTSFVLVDEEGGDRRPNVKLAEKEEKYAAAPEERKHGSVASASSSSNNPLAKLNQAATLQRTADAMNSHKKREDNRGKTPTRAFRSGDDDEEVVAALFKKIKWIEAGLALPALAIPAANSATTTMTAAVAAPVSDMEYTVDHFRLVAYWIQTGVDKILLDDIRKYLTHMKEYRAGNVANPPEMPSGYTPSYPSTASEQEIATHDAELWNYTEKRKKYGALAEATIVQKKILRPIRPPTYENTLFARMEIALEKSGYNGIVAKANTVERSLKSVATATEATATTSKAFATATINWPHDPLVTGFPDPRNNLRESGYRHAPTAVNRDRCVCRARNPCGAQFQDYDPINFDVIALIERHASTCEFYYALTEEDGLDVFVKPGKKIETMTKQITKKTKVIKTKKEEVIKKLSGVPLIGKFEIPSTSNQLLASFLGYCKLWNAEASTYASWDIDRMVDFLPLTLPNGTKFTENDKDDFVFDEQSKKQVNESDKLFIGQTLATAIAIKVLQDKFEYDYDTWKPVLSASLGLLKRMLTDVSKANIVEDVFEKFGFEF